MKSLKYIAYISIVLATFFTSCIKEIDTVTLSRERSILDLKLYGQLGNPIIERTEDSSNVYIYILDNEKYPYDSVNVEGIVLSSQATSDVDKGSKLNFYNPERMSKITVISQSKEKQVWRIFLKPYNAFFVGTWRIEDLKIYVDQMLSGSGTGKWETQMNGNEFGYFATPEYDNQIKIEMSQNMVNGEFVGTINNDSGPDGLYGSFKGVYPGEYPLDNPLDMNPRLRHLIPPGESSWSLNLTTNEMKITQNNITSTLTFGTDTWGNTLFQFALPNASGDPAGSNFYNNFWRSSYKFTYVLRQVGQ